MGKGGRFGKYGDLKRKQQIRKNRLSHLGNLSPSSLPVDLKIPRRRKKKQSDETCEDQSGISEEDPGVE